jgi:hypothetical protein
MPIVHLSDSQLDQIFRAARPLPVRDRDAFLQAVADGLRGKILGDDEVYRAALAAQRLFFDAPVVEPGHQLGVGKYA